MGLIWNQTPEQKEKYRRDRAKWRWLYTVICAEFLFTFLVKWRETHFTATIFLPPSDWHRWWDWNRLYLFNAVLQTVNTVSAWKAWLEIRAEERLRKLQESQTIPTEGVWPPAPRME